MGALRKARALRPGDTIGIAAPAFAVEAERVEAGAERLRGAGFRVCCREDVTEQQGYLAGSDERRAAELMELVREPQVAAILCARGGYGCHRIVPRLEAGAVSEASKALLGYSDVTTLLLWQHRCAGLVGFHAPMLDCDGALAEEEFEALLCAVQGRDAGRVWSGEAQGGGRAEGWLLGGSLTLLAASLGTPWEPDTRGAILLFEEVAEKPYALDRLLQQLRAAGKLEGVVGIGVGHLTECVDPRRPAPTAEQVVREVLEPLGRPLVFGLPFGHGRPNLPWPVGVRGRIDGERGELAILEAGVVPE